MLDSALVRLIQGPLSAVAAGLVKLGVSADAITCAGFAIGIGGAAAIAGGHPAAGLVLVLLSRLCDGLDGAVARLTQPTDRGAFLDITLDFLFYASIPLGFAWANPGDNALAAATLLAAFFGTGASFLAFAVLAGRRGLHSSVYPNKGFFYLGGLTEASETLLVFVLMCIWPAAFPVLAYTFAGLCVVTTVARLAAGWRALGD